MRYISRFKSINDTAYSVTLDVPSVVGRDQEITLGMTPFDTTMESPDDVYVPVKSQGATVRILQSGMVYFSNLYAPDAQHCKVTLTDTTHNQVKWIGYGTPVLYSQSWAYQKEVLEYECVSPIATLKYYTFSTPSLSTRTKVKNIIADILKKCNTFDYFCFSDSMYKTSGVSIVDELYLNQNMFVNENVPDKNWTYQEALEEICRYFQVTAVESFEDSTVYFIDYDAIINNNNKYYKYKISDATRVGASTVEYKDSHSMGSTYMGDDTNLSLSEVYNKVTVKIDPVELDDDKNLDVFSTEGGLEEYTDTTSDENKLLIWADSPLGTIKLLEYEGQFGGVNAYKSHGTDDYQVFLKMFKNNKCAQCFLYERSNNDAGSWVPQTRVTPYDKIFTDHNQEIYQNLLTYRGAVLMKGGAEKIEYKDGVAKLIPSESLNDYIMMLVRGNVDNDTNYKQFNNRLQELSNAKTSYDGKYPRTKVFTYTDNVKSSKKDKYLVVDFSCNYSNDGLRPFPYGAIDVKKDDADDLNRFIWAQVKVGNYYLCGTASNLFAHNAIEDFKTVQDGVEYKWENLGASHASTPYDLHDKCRFYFHELDNATGKDLNLVSNVDWRMHIESDKGVAFKLPDDVKVGDKIEFSFYLPHSFDQHVKCEYVFIKDFTCEVQESDPQKYSTKEEVETIYSIDIDENYVTEFSEVTDKICTYDGKKVNISSVMDSSGEYVDGLFNKDLVDDPELANASIESEDVFSGKLRAEWWQCYRYYKQYSTPSVMLDTTLQNIGKPYSVFTNIINGGTNFVVGGINRDFWHETAQFKLIEKK